MNPQLNPLGGDHLRRDAVVIAWIDDYQKDAHNKHEDCRMCGWPHSPVTLCGMGSVFARLWLGGKRVYVDSSNVAYLRDLVGKLNAFGFHWRNEVFFARVGEHVAVSFIELFNGCPSVQQWKIPVNEFASIVCAGSVGGETTERYARIVEFLGRVPPPDSTKDTK